jgi:putative transposase
MSNINSFLQKSFSSFLSSITLPLNSISYQLVKVAKSNSYIETLGENADSLHIWIKKSYEVDFKKAFEKQVRKAIKRLHVNYASLAFDITAEPFYGKTRGLYIFDTPKNKKFDGEFKFITVCLITRNKQIPLMALPVMIGEGSGGKLAVDLLDFCQTLFKKIRFAVFDRGFYIAELIDYLEANKIRFIILVPEKKGKIKGYVEETKQLGKFKHKMKYSKDKSCWKPKTTIVVCKGVDKFAWIFATNMHFNTRIEYIWNYKRRWQIETNYRVEDESRIKSKSTNYLIRYFYFLVSLLLHLFWIVNKNLNYYVQFKKYLDNIERETLFEYLKLEQI